MITIFFINLLHIIIFINLFPKLSQFRSITPIIIDFIKSLKYYQLFIYTCKLVSILLTIYTIFFISLFITKIKHILCIKLFILLRHGLSKVDIKVSKLSSIIAVTKSNQPSSYPGPTDYHANKKTQKAPTFVIGTQKR